MGKVTKERLASMPSKNTNGRSLLQCLTSFKNQLDSNISEGSVLIKRAPGALLQPDVSIKRIREAHDVDSKVPARPAQSPACSAPSPGLANDAVQNATALAQIDEGPQESSNNHREQRADPVRRTQDEVSTSGRPGVQGLAEVSFYSKWRLGEVERCVLRLLAAARQKLHGGTSDPYQVFPLQERAFKWADNHLDAPDVRIFSSERGPEGKRCFIATTLEGFWKRYRDMLPQHRHCYEIIRHGYPCHLYFDLEYRKEFNANVDGDALVDTVLQLCAKGLKDKFQLDFEESWVLELDSSSPEKFSRHVILRIPGAAFQNNFHVGAFVKDICAGVGKDEPDDPDNPAQHLLINKDGQGKRALFIDGGVYTRNRAFRLFLSSKAGKEWVLQPTERFQGARLSHRDTFFASLICNVPEGCRLLRCFEDEDGAAFSWVRHGRLSGPSRYSEAAMERCAQPQLGPSRHPDIERFITSVCNQGGVQGAVRSWVEWPEAGLLLLNMRHNRWCGNVGRAHRSNGIFYVVSLQEGVWYQKCYDPECRDYRSEMMPLPNEIVARLQAEQQMLEECHPQSASTAPARQDLSHDGVAPCVTSASGSAREANHAGVDALVGSAAHACHAPPQCGGGMGIFEGMQEDEACDRELLSMLEACEARLQQRQGC